MKTVLTSIKTSLLVWAACMLCQLAVAQQTPPGNALHFDGVDDYVAGTFTTSPILVPPSEFTIEAWVKIDAAGYFNIMAIGNSNPNGGPDLFSLSYSTVANITNLKVGCFDRNILTNTGPPNARNVRLVTSHWNHIALTAANAKISLYINGILTISDYQLPGSVASPFYYGQNTLVSLGKKINEANGGNPLLGSIDEVTLWRTAHTQQQIIADMSRPVTNPAINTDLLMYYDCNDQGIAGVDNTGNSAASTLMDRGQYGLNGTLNGFALTGGTSNWVKSYSMVIPTAAAASDITPTGFTANWVAPVLNSVDNFKVMVATDGAFTQVVSGYDSVATVGNVTSLAITGLQPGTQYYYRVRADKADVSGQGAFTAGTAVKTVGLPEITSFTPTYGQEGTTVTISGTNFNFSSAVSFGGTPATSFNLVNDNTLTAIIGTGTTGPIGISTTGGTGYSTSDFTFIRPLLVTDISPATGSMGTVVTITGQGFTNASAVSFGGTAPTSYTIVNDNTINAIIGNGATGDVTVTNGTNFTVPAAFTYVSNLQITAVSPAAAGTGVTVTITGQDFAGTTAISFGGIPPESFTVVSNTQITALIGKGATGDVTVTNGTRYTLPAAFNYTAPSAPGNALQFDGIDDYVRLLGNPTKRFISISTLEFWMKTTQNTNGVAVGLVDGEVGSGVRDFGVYLKDGKIIARTGETDEFTQIQEYSVTSVSDVNTGQWVHVAVVFNGEPMNLRNLTLFINGRQEAKSWVSSYGWFSAVEFITLGCSTSFAPGTFFNGTLDEVRFLSTDRSANITEDMSSTEPLSNRNRSVYHFDQGVLNSDNTAITTLVNFGIQTIAGQLNNFALQGNTSNWVESYAIVCITNPATNLMSNSFTANWSLPSFGVVDSLKLTVATDQAFTNILPDYNNKPLAGTTTSLAITGLNPLTPYYYRVRADKASVKGQGANSPTMKVITPSTPFVPPGNAISFNGANDYIRINSPVSRTFTMEFWMKTTQTGAGNPGDPWTSGTGIVDAYQAASAGYFGVSLLGSKLSFGSDIPTLNVVSTSDVNTGQWVHVAVVWYGDPYKGIARMAITLFINGVEEASAFRDAGDFFYGDRYAPTITIGANNDLSHYFKGSLDELKIYSGNRSAAISYDMYGQPSINDNDLLSYYDFEQGLPAQNNTGITTLYDQSLKDNNGMLYNFALDGHTSNWVGSYAMVVPTALAATSVASRGFTANWTPPVVGQPDGYKITVATDAAFTQIVPGCDSLEAAGNTTSLAIAGLAGGTQYYYRVRAYIAIGEGQGNYSNAVSVTTNTCTPGADMLAANTNEGNGSIASGQSILLMVDGSGCREVAGLQSMGSSPVAGNIAATVWVDATQPAKYVKRHYEITPVTADGITPAANASTATGKVTLYFTQEEFDDFNGANSTQLPKNPTDIEGNIPNLRIEKRSGISSDGSGSPNTYPALTPETFKPADKNGSVVWNGTAARWEISFEVTGFSGFFVKTAGTALPLRLISFTGTQEATTNNLKWQTADEVNTLSFELESSRDGRSFEKVATIDAVSAGDNSYGYTDRSIYKGIVYYRLRMIDIDGTFSYSRMVWLSREGKGAINLYPNPTTDHLTLSLDNGLINSEAKLYDASGKLLQTIKIASAEELINVKNLPTGVYIIKFKDGSTGSFVKE
ncbi:LamG-like jellyroll fold domain-containing protein [Dyadobacter sp. 32]|uniref:LamG-like jellyroll fold domain-containing protein n=1 Tax=Dyadobacter sp. 32 TaxID=538966 RepID=UPI0011EF38C1